MGEEELEAVTRVIKARSPFRHYGPDVQHTVDRLESAWCERFGRRHAVAVNSGSTALYVALAALGIGPGDEVLVPGYLWVSCLSAVVRLGAVPRLVDIDDTLCMSPEALRRAIGPRSRALIFVHMNGALGSIVEATAIAREAGLAVLEDCAQALGASAGGRAGGSFGDVAVYSLQLNKNITSGEGGMITCDDDELFERCLAVHDLGYKQGERGRLDPDERYHLWGVGCRMSELAGAMALAQLGKLDAITSAMRGVKYEIRAALAQVRGIGLSRTPDPEGDTGAALVTTYPTPELCIQFTAALRAEGVSGPGVLCLPLARFGLHWYFNNLSLRDRKSLSRDGFPWTHPANAFAAAYNYGAGALPFADDLAARGAVYALSPTLDTGCVADIIAAFRKVAAALL